MNYNNETDLLFDDASAIKSILGEDSLRITAVNADCDCISYTSTSDDENVGITNLLLYHVTTRSDF